MTRLFEAGLLLTLCSFAASEARPFPGQEKPVFKNEGATMRLGLDGKVYVSSGTLFLRCNRDGGDPLAAPPGASVSNATANADGISTTLAAWLSF